MTSLVILCNYVVSYIIKIFTLVLSLRVLSLRVLSLRVLSLRVLSLNLLFVVIERGAVKFTGFWMDGADGFLCILVVEHTLFVAKVDDALVLEL